MKKTIILVEEFDNFEYYLGHEYSFPCGAARFNINHKNVIKLMKDFGLLDMRTHKGQLPNTKFIDVKNDFNKTYKKKMVITI